MALDWLATFFAICCGRWITQTPLMLWSQYPTGHPAGADALGLARGYPLQANGLPRNVGTVRSHCLSEADVPGGVSQPSGEVPRGI